jgi:hypothetical protein
MWDNGNVLSLVSLVAIGVFLLGSIVGYILRGTVDSGSYRERSHRPYRFLVAICLGVAGTLAWQSYGGATKQMIMTSIHWPSIHWPTKRSFGPEIAAGETVAPKGPSRNDIPD